MSEHNPCISYCEHGGICVLDNGHSDLHNSEYCQWSDTEALEKAEADKRMMENGLKNGYSIADIKRIAEET